MGLLLSVLVTCVGVIELLTFYHRVKTRVYPAPIETDVTSVKEQYLKELEDVRDTLTEQLKNLKLQQSLPTLEVNTADSHSAQGIRKSRAQECLPDYLVEEKDCECAHNTQKCLSSEHESRRDVFRKKLGHNIVEVDGEVFYRRSPSPFPSFDLTAPRNSICSVLLEESSSFPEIDERSRSSSPRNPELNNNYSEKVNRILQDALASHSCADYWEHKKLHVPQLKSRSPSPGRSILSKEGDMRRSLSESRNVSFSLEVPPIQESVSNLELRRIRHSESSDDEESVEVGAFTDEMKDNLDDLQKKKGCVKKRYVKKKRMKNPNKIGSDKSDDMSRNQSAKETTDQEKAGKPFWVNPSNDELGY